MFLSDPASSVADVGKQVVQVKLVPTPEQAQALEQTDPARGQRGRELDLGHGLPARGAA